jgi:hypothetical protein
MNDTKTAAEVRIFDSYDNMTHQDELVVKPAVAATLYGLGKYNEARTEEINYK